MVATDIFSNFGWTTTLKNKDTQTIGDSFENILITSKREPHLIEKDDGKEFVNMIVSDFLN